MHPIDLRSDTVTRPTAAMRRAMANASVGDDVYGEDPEANALEEEVAERLGHEAAVFFPSGTMANQAALRLLTRPGDVVVAGRDAHILRFEAGAAAALSGLQIRTLEAGVFAADTLRRAIHPGDLHVPPTTVVAVENTHNASGGRVFPFEPLMEIVDLGRDAGLGLHLDGARLFNAAVATGIEAKRWASRFDTVSVCLSKGLGTPAGSVVATARTRISELRRIRKMLGGAMRQVGILAAAGRYALAHHIERLREDHRHAARLAAGLRELGFVVDGEPETNMVMFRPSDPKRFAEELRARSIRINPIDPQRFRAVTHLDVSEVEIEEVLERLADVDP